MKLTHGNCKEPNGDNVGKRGRNLMSRLRYSETSLRNENPASLFRDGQTDRFGASS